MRSLGNLVALLSLPVLALACSADSPMDADASGQNLTDGGGLTIPDAQAVRPDSRTVGAPDAIPQVTCDGADTEPNNVQLDAVILPAITDCDDEGGSFAGSVISGNEDWFTFDTSDSALCNVGPEVNLVGNVQVCLLFACNEGTLDLTCPKGTTAPGGGADGCCGNSSFVVADYNCVDTGDEASKVHGQVTALSTNTCETYTIDFNF
jgi:hypothetical protein